MFKLIINFQIYLKKLLFIKIWFELLKKQRE